MAASKKGEKARVLSQLGSIGDFLHEQGDISLEAAVRTEAFLLGQYRPSTLLDAIGLAAARLRESGQPEMAQTIEAGMTILEARRPAVGVELDASSHTLAAFAAYPGLEAEVRAWIADPAPKLNGLRISLTISAWSELIIYLEVNNDPESPIRIGHIPKAGETATRTLEKCHKAVIARLRKQTAK
jgi:hypothetical protein